MSFGVANIWKTFDNSKSLDGKFRQKVVFFEEGRELDEFVCVDVEVVSVCRPSTRPSSRLFVKHSTFASTSSLILTFVLLLGLLFVKGLMAEGLMAEGLMAEGLMAYSS